MQGRARGMMTPGSGLGDLTLYKPRLEDPWVRFQIELEFVQSLGNPDYLTFLAQHGCFEKPEFINYLSYLRYWNNPSYSRFIVYPFCLHMLELLQSSNFHREVARGSVTRFIDDQMLLHWQNYIRKRAEMISRHVQVLETAGDPKLNPGAGPTSASGSNSASGPFHLS